MITVLKLDIGEDLVCFLDDRLNEYLYPEISDPDLRIQLFANTVFAVHPVQIVHAVNLHTREETCTLIDYCPYTEDYIIPLPKFRIVTHVLANQQLIDHYVIHLRAQRKKSPGKFSNMSVGVLESLEAPSTPKESWH